MPGFPRARRGATALLAGLALAAAAGCGGDDGDDLTSEDALRNCLTDAGLTIEPPDLGNSASLGSASPDFRVLSGGGQAADVIVEGREEKALKTAADIEGAKQSFGAAQSVVVRERNTVVVFEDAPSEEFSREVEGCAG